MQLFKNLELVEVDYDGDKAILTFLDAENEVIQEVNFNKQKWDNENAKFVDDPEKAKQIEEKVQEIFGTSFDKLDEMIGTSKDVYVYDNFNALEYVEITEKFPLEDVGDIFETKIETIEDSGIAFLIKYKRDDKLHQSKMTYSNFITGKNKWFRNEKRYNKQLQNFEKKFGVPFSEKNGLIGKKIMVEIKQGNGKFADTTFGDIKKLQTPKKK